MRLSTSTALDMLSCRANELRSIPSSALDKILREHERQTSLILLRGTCDEHKGLIELPCYLEGYILDDRTRASSWACSNRRPSYGPDAVAHPSEPVAPPAGGERASEGVRAAAL